MGASEMKLFTVTDAPDDDESLFAWWAAVWAESDIEALEWARYHYGGECPAGCDPGIRVVLISEQAGELRPIEAGVHPENRMAVLRLARWRCDGESECDSCGLFANGLAAFAVCADCYLCKACRDERHDGDTCESCCDQSPDIE